MPRQPNGTFTLVPGNPVIPDTVIEASWANPTMEDIANGLTGAVARNGTAGMTAPLILSADPIEQPLQAVSKGYVDTFIARATGMPIGAVFAYSGAGALGSAYLLCDGSAISRTQYADLFAAIGTTYGAGDGSTTFNIPNLQDWFIRGKGASRALGSQQLDAVGPHTHTATAPEHFHSVSGVTNAMNSNKTHTHQATLSVGAAAGSGGLMEAVATTPTTSGTVIEATSVDHTHNWGGNTNPQSIAITVAANTPATETVPKNIAMFYYIKSTNDTASNALYVEATGVFQSAVIPTGTTAQRDAAPQNGYLRYNTDFGAFEGYDNGLWIQVGAEAGAQGPAGPQGQQGPVGPNGPEGPDGPQGVQGIEGPIGLTGSAVVIIDEFGASKVPADLPVSGFLPANWDAPGSPAIDTQMVLGQALVYKGAAGIDYVYNSVWGFVGPADASGWINLGTLTAGQGPQGPQGIAGPQGNQGIQGQEGPVGAQGNAGSQGTQGLQGIIGPTGIQGPTGANGTGGQIVGSLPGGSPAPANPELGDMWIATGTIVGWVNASANDGILWDGFEWLNIGPIQGPQGVSGPQGIQGAQGPQGPQGLLGPTGPTGSQGVSGPQGIQGQQGVQGVEGQQGIQGSSGTGTTVIGNFGASKVPADLPPSGLIPANWDAPGKPVNPYQMQINQALMYQPSNTLDPLYNHMLNYVGTQETSVGWVDVGDLSGPQGIQGDQGIQGIQGPAGPIGPEGPEGPPGATTAIGVSFTPVGGIIATNVQAALQEVDVEKAPLNGIGTSGSWPISVTGSAASATSATSAASVSGNTTAAVQTGALGSGTANATVFLRGDRTWAAPAGGSSDNPTFTGTAKFPDGTVLLPSITNTGDENTGFYFPAADTIAWTCGGVEQYRVSGKSFLADFSSADTADRFDFVTSVTNGATGVTALPNGSSTTAGWVAVNKSGANANNSSYVTISANATRCSIESGKYGTGTYLPLDFYVGGSQRANIAVDGTFEFKETKDTVGTIAASAAPVINPSAGNILIITLNQNSAFNTGSIESGQSVTLMIAPTSFTATFVGVWWVGGSPPSLSAAGWNIMELWNAGGTVFGAFAGVATA